MSLGTAAGPPGAVATPPNERNPPPGALKIGPRAVYSIPDGPGPLQVCVHLAPSLECHIAARSDRVPLIAQPSDTPKSSSTGAVAGSPDQASDVQAAPSSEFQNMLVV